MQKFLKLPITALTGVALAAGLGVAPALAGQSTVNPVVTPDASSAVAAANFSQSTATLTIHKFAQTAAAGSANGDGSEQSNVTGTAVSGASYTVTQVTSINGQGVDLTTPEGWTQFASKINEGSITSPDDLGTYSTEGGASGTGTTGENGVTTIGNLPLGLYVVSENIDNAQVVGNNNAKVVTPSPDFLVTLPMVNPNYDSATAGSHPWNYAVHAYPKNPFAEADKAVDDADAVAAGDTVEWDITVTIPHLTAEKPDFTTFEIVDTLPAGLTPVAVDAANTHTVTVDGSKFTSLAPARDEKGGELFDEKGGQIFEETDGFTVTVTGQTVTATITPEGLTALKDYQGQTLTFTVVSTVDEVTANSTGILTNNAQVHVDDATFDVSDKTYWGRVELTKYTGTEPQYEIDEKTGELLSSGEPTNEQLLAGAQFQVFTTPDASGDPVSVNGVTTFTSDANGKVYINGLKAGETGTTYYIKETKAPAGYVLDETIHAVFVTADEDQNGNVDTNTLFVNNEQSNVPSLPVTGASAILLTVLVGGGLLTAGGVTLANSRKKAKANA